MSIGDPPRCKCGRTIIRGGACGCTFCECGAFHSCQPQLTFTEIPKPNYKLQDVRLTKEQLYKNHFPWTFKKKEEEMTGVMYSDIVVTNNGVYEAREMNNTYFNTYTYLELVPCTTF